MINPVSGAKNVTRNKVLSMSLMADIFVVISFTMAIIFIQKISYRAIREFKTIECVLETNDFAVQITGLPPIKEFRHE